MSTWIPALTVRQPWAWAIFHGKNVENRSGWRYKHTGRLFIHAGLHLADAAAFGAVKDLSVDQLPMLGAPKAPTEATLGGLIGTVDLAVPHWWTDCRAPGGRLCSPWAQRDQWHLPLSNQRPLAAPMPTPGKLGIWYPARHLTANIDGRHRQ